MYFKRIHAVLALQPGLEFVGQAASGEEAVDLARARCPDVVVMDLHLPGLNGVEATRQVLAANPRIRVLVLSMLDDDESVVAALRAGACGYILKEWRAEIGGRGRRPQQANRCSIPPSPTGSSATS